MLPNVFDAIQSFRRRLQLAAFTRGALMGCFVVTVCAAVLLLGERLLEGSQLGAWPSWVWWGGAAMVALANGCFCLRGLQLSDATVAAHLEKRLSSHGLSSNALLLAASEGVELDRAFQTKLSNDLLHVPEVLPTIRWRSLLPRPVAAAGLLAAMLCLPAHAPQQQGGEALAVVTQRLSEQVEQLAAREQVPEERLQDLRQAVADLQQRAKAGDESLWREIDQLRERIAREQKLAAVADGAAEAQSQPSSDAGRRAAPATPAAKELADAMAKLAALRPDAAQDLLGKLSKLDAATKQAIAAAMQPDGSVDASQLPDDPASRSALAEAVAEQAKELAGDPAALLEMAAGMSPEQRQQLAEQLVAIAQQFGDLDLATAGEEPATGEPPSRADDPAQAPELQAPELSAEIAKAAVEMAKSGLLDKLPEALRTAMMDASMAALEQLDVEKLAGLLPDDMSQLTAMAQDLAKLAESMQAGSASNPARADPAGTPSGNGDMKVSPEMQAKLAKLAKGLLAKLAPGSGKAAGPGPQGVAGGSLGRDGGSHAALRLTETTSGGGGTIDVVLPERDLGALPTEWRPVSVEKATPEVGGAQAAGVGRAGASGSGGATWQLRLMPRHRDVVRRFFAEKNK